MTNRGVTLLELVIGLLISTMITGVLMNLFSSSLKSLKRVTEVAEKDQNVTVLLYQLQQDLQGAVMPALRSTATTQASPSQGSLTEGGSASPGKQIPKAFESTEKNKKFEQLTFITTNPRTRFVSPLPTVLPKPQIVRVTYNLRGNALYRTETTELVPDPKKKYESLLVVDGLSTFSLSFKYTLTTEKQPEVKTELAWSSDQAFEKESKLPPLPQAVVVTHAKGDFYIPIPCYQQGISVKYPPAQPQQQPQEQQAQRPGIPRMKIGFKQRPTFLDKYFGKPA